MLFSTQRISNLFILIGAFALTGCGVLRSDTAPPLAFKPVTQASATAMMSKEDLALIEESVNPVYRLGAGDAIRIDVFGRPEISGKHTIGPDGAITLPIAGVFNLVDLSREEASAVVQVQLGQYFKSPHVTLAVEEYTSNQVTVLGRVERAGIQKFSHAPTLAEVLAGAGAMPILDKQATLSQCAIMRGREKLIWVDLKALLNGDAAYNIRMKKGDIVFIPDSSDTAIYVMGAVLKPGSYRLTPRMSLLDVLAQAGGPGEDAKTGKIALYRMGAKDVELIDFQDLIDGGRAVNYSMQDGDVVFVPRRDLADMGYWLKQISPGLSVLSFMATMKAANK
jgi:polysaccharide export outer membrane protein